jgi:hypothetical protein
MRQIYTLIFRFFALVLCVLFLPMQMNAQISYNVDWERYNLEILANYQYSDGIYRDILPVNSDNYRIVAKVHDENWINADTSGIDLRWVIANQGHAVVSLSVYHLERKPVVEISCFPFKFDSEGTLKKLHNYSVSIQPVAEKSVTVKAYSNQSVLANGDWIKLSTDKRGILKITYDKLKEYGIANPQNISVYSNGGHMLPKMNADFYPDDLMLNPVYHGKDVSGKDCVFFYSSGNTKVSYNKVKGLFEHEINNFTDSVFFFITSDLTKSPAVPVAQKISGQPELTLTEFDEYKYIEDETNNLIASGRQFYGKNFKTESRQTFRFNLSNVVAGKEVKFRVNAAARSSVNSTMDLYVNGAFQNKLFFPYVYTTDTYAQYASSNDTIISLAPKDLYEFVFNYFVQGGGEAWINFLSVQAMQKLKYNGVSFNFRAVNALGANSVQYAIENGSSNMQVWDVTVPYSAQQMANRLTDIA